MAEQLLPRPQAKPAEKMPRDAAQVVLWFKGLPQPTAFVVERDEATAVERQFAVGDPHVRFKSYPDGSGYRSDSSFLSSELRGITVEYPSIQFMTATH